MKAIILSILFVLSLAFIGCNDDDEILAVPEGINASDGTYIGTIFITWDLLPGVGTYQIVRRDPLTGEWVDVGLWGPPPYWDQGWMLPSNQIVPGQIYEYKCRAHKNGPGFSEYGDIETGYAFDADKVEITEISDQDGDNFLVWNDPNNESLLVNHTRTKYIIYRASELDLGNFNILDETEEQFYTDRWVEPEEIFYYKIAVRYYCMVSGSEIIYDFEAGDMVKGEGGGGTQLETISYTKTPLGNVNSLNGGIPFLELKISNGVPYLGVLKDFVANGSAAMYKLNGTIWEEAGGTLPGDISNGSLSGMAIATGNTNMYIAGLSSNDVFIYESNGTNWSTNLAQNNFGDADSPAGIDIEVMGDELYVAVEAYPDYDLKVLKWTGSDWATVGGDANGWIETGDLFNVGLSNLDGTLYLYYTVKNADFNHTLHIRHLNTSTWDSDLTWTADYIDDIHIARGNGKLYFMSSTQSFANYGGGIYEVTSPTTVETLADKEDDWFYTPMAITVDSEGNVIIASDKLESQTVHYPALSIWNGTSWKAVSGIFSDGMEPVALITSGTEIYYVYGDITSENATLDPTKLLSAKFSK